MHLVCLKEWLEKVEADKRDLRRARAMKQQMNKFFGSAVTLAALATPVVAHPADHSLAIFESIAHLLTQPDHLAPFALVVVGAFAVFKFRTRKA